MKWAILNGEMIERSNAKVDIEDRGNQFGDGVYEVIRLYNGKMFSAEEHLNRFFRSLANIGISSEYTQDQLLAMLEELIKRENLQNGTIYMQMTRGAAPRVHAFPAGKVTPTLTAYTKQAERPVENLQFGVKAILLEDIRWLRCDIKSLNLLGNVLAKQQAHEKGCFEAIQHRRKNITEGSSSNIFIVKNGVIVTHESNNLILKGITKDVLLRICSKNGIPFEERAFTIQELDQADEVFLTSTTAEVMPIVEIDGKQIKDGDPGPLTRQLQTLFEAEIERQCGPLTGRN